MSTLGQWKHVSSLRICKRSKDGMAKANTKTILPFFQSILSVFVSVITSQIKAPANKHVLVTLNYYAHDIHFCSQQEIIEGHVVRTLS